MSVPQSIISLVNRFEQNRESYKSSSYNETQLRREFLDPFFEALGWDISNKQDHAEAYKDVVHEDAIKIGTATKAPDYSFRVGGTRKFFVEAKKPFVNIKVDIAPAFQLRRYAWSAKLPLSILTDFEEFAVYDCRFKPVKTDKASIGRIFYVNFDEYEKRWDEIAGIFSKESVLKGSFDRYVLSSKSKRGTSEVDDAILTEIEGWRDILARNIAIRNVKLSNRELNFVVQRTIDRLIFLRICEDRGIEDYGRLQAHLNGVNVYKRLCVLFREADDKYNSGLFHFREEKGRDESPDNITLKIDIDDKVLKQIIQNLYPPDSPYEFSVLPADILGQVYEQFLGKVIRLTPGHLAKVEDKPEVKKAGGVFYTPTYIVDYIVKNTVGKLLEGKSPKQAASLRILDPSCGSGSFLIGAYQYLLDWQLNWYERNDPAKWLSGKSPAIYKARAGEYRLTTPERKKILLNNIYGIDIDTQAVEVTKLSLLLKVLEGENEQTISQQLKLWHERALPDLGNNIKCGNSLISTDFYSSTQLDLFGLEERYRINAFNWSLEFEKIFNENGFDSIIGNPPWGAFFSEAELEYLRSANKEIIVRMIDSFMYFVYHSLNKIKPKGIFGMILPDVLLYQTDNEKLRQFIITNHSLTHLINLGNVFDKVVRPACIAIVNCMRKDSKPISILDITAIPKNEKAKEINNVANYSTVTKDQILSTDGTLFITGSAEQYSILDKIKSGNKIPLAQIVDDDGIQRGVSPDLKKAFIVDKKTIKDYSMEKTNLKKTLTGGVHVKRYFIIPSDLFLIYNNNHDDFSKIPNICKYIDTFKTEITCSEVKAKKHSIYALHRARKEIIFTKPFKFVGVITEDQIVVALDNECHYVTDGLYTFSLKTDIDPYFIMAILNSKLFVYLYRLVSFEKGRVLAQVKPTIIGTLPICLVTKENKSIVTEISSLAKHLCSLYGNSVNSTGSHEALILQRTIGGIEDKIDSKVYSLYNLTKEEISSIKSNVK